jgi:hypothetical protein
MEPATYVAHAVAALLFSEAKKADVQAIASRVRGNRSEA